MKTINIVFDIENTSREEVDNKIKKIVDDIYSRNAKDNERASTLIRSLARFAKTNTANDFHDKVEKWQNDMLVKKLSDKYDLLRNFESLLDDLVDLIEEHSLLS